MVDIEYNTQDKKRVLVVGDLIEDHYIHVKSDRIAQEANIPVWKKASKAPSSDIRPGGAGNLAVNIKSLGGSNVEVDVACINSPFFGIRKHYMGVNFPRDCPFRKSFISKYRYVNDNGDILFRYDDEDKITEFYRDRFVIRHLNELLTTNAYDVIVVSDYCKGTINQDIVDMISVWDCIKIVDSKRYDLSMYEGFDILNINEDEYNAQLSNKDYIVEQLFDNIVVTRGKRGADLIFAEKLEENKYRMHSRNFKTEEVIPADVTGCGDTFTAALTVGMMTTGNVLSSIKFANQAATAATKLIGTGVVKNGDI